MNNESNINNSENYLSEITKELKELRKGNYTALDLSDSNLDKILTVFSNISLSSNTSGNFLVYRLTLLFHSGSTTLKAYTLIKNELHYEIVDRLVAITHIFLKEEVINENFISAFFIQRLLKDNSQKYTYDFISEFFNKDIADLVMLMTK